MQVAKLIGGAGTGKTTELLKIMDGVIERILDPHLVGFVSFTRAARREAADRAAEKFNMRRSELEQSGWFRTIHSIAYKCLGVGKELITDDAESRKWVQEALQEPVAGVGGVDGEDALDVFATAENDADRALSLWAACRNRLRPLADEWRAADGVDDRTPTLEYCRAVAERYEQAKRLDHRVDFVDLLGMFAGYSFGIDGPEKGEPDGEPPKLPAWIFDEQQDTSALADAVCRRLVNTDGCQWVYLAGDPFQAIYQFSGADPTYFMGWPADKTRTMPKSYRCPAEILSLGESLLTECSDYFDRRIAPAEHDGEVDAIDLEEITDEVSPTAPWLVLARTNYQASRLGRLLTDAGIPWTPTRGRGHWDAPVRNMACKALMSMESGGPVSGDEWQAVLKQIPSNYDGEALLTRGTKSRFAEMEETDAADAFPFVLPPEWSSIGVMDALDAMVRSGKWRGLVDGADDYAAAIDRWGQEVVDNPSVKVGTVHSVKGSEADNVALLTTISRPIFEGCQSVEGKDAEQRVWYVGVTRARKRLVIVNERRPKYRKRIG
jgi:DNA helicase-2/ATP-dependent DNA helicase PcrA